MGRLPLLFLGLLAALAPIQAYYVPGTYPQEFYKGDQLQGAAAKGEEPGRFGPGDLARRAAFRQAPLK
jgi:hypothetical protein